MGDYTTQIMMEEFGEGLSGAMLVFYLIYMAFMLVISVGSYVLQSVSLYTIAKRRGIHKPWLSWLPVGDAWILGCISDQYQYVVKGKVKNKRKALLVLNIIMWTVYVAFFAVYFVLLFQIIGGVLNDQLTNAGAMELMGSVAGILALFAVMMGVSIAILVIRYIALYDLYHSCDPDSSIAYLLLSIFLGIAQPLFLFLCRKKDDGMPPRKQAPVHIPDPTAEPWQNTEE